MGLDSYALEDDGRLEEQKLDLGRYIVALKRRWWLAGLIALLVTVPWTIYVKREKPIYKATASIRFRDLTGNPDAMMEDIYEQLTSRTFVEQVVRDLGLVVSIRQDPDRKRFLIRRHIFSKFTSSKEAEPGTYELTLLDDGRFSLSLLDEDNEREILIRQGEVYRAMVDTISVRGFSFQLADSQNLPARVVFDIAPFRSAAQSLQQRIRVSLNNSWTLMFVTLRGNDPYIVKETVNSLAHIFIDKSKSYAKGVESTQLETLRAQVERARRDYEDVDRRMTQKKKQMKFGGQELYQVTLAQHNTATKELTALRGLRDSLRDLLEKLKTSTEESSGEVNVEARETRRYVYNAIATSPAFDNNSTMIVTRQRLADLERRWANEVALKTDSHPDVVALQQQIDKLHTQIESAARLRLQSLNREVNNKQREVSRLAAEVRQLPTQESELADLQRELNLKSEYYDRLRSQLQQAEITEAVEKPRIEILDPAIEPEYPINRNKKAKAAAGGVFGLLLGLGVVIGLEALDRSIKSVDDIRNSMKLNVLGSIPKIDFGEYFEFQDHEIAKMVDQQLVTHDFAPTPIGEAYRSLRTNILFTKTAGRIQTLVITSTAPGDGKSFTAANLSITMAQQKSNTLLIDTDLRRGVLHNTFGVAKEPGFSNFLTGSVLASEIINETQVPNLSVISCGSLIPNPSELLGSVQLRRFLDEMRRKYDLIIFDTPPLNAATDAVVLGTQVDGTVIVVRAGKTKKDVARQKLEMFQHVDAKILGVILNGTTADLAHEGYSYYHY